ncbi:Transcription factor DYSFUNCTIONAL TAPETUM 1 [Morella rubra]|uniref:Transcription factor DYSFUNCTIONAL TAPETUM 1 n=1 Tax=Morella rubra TaxID=262757 RepID=A0A6A1UMY6_9ROSI|nr:Transcription factor DYSFUNCTIONAL TAPETUM 1 [Morella rubra]
MEQVGFALGELCITGEGSSRGRMGRKRHSDDIEDTSQFKSKNLKAERKRREKLSNRLLTLRALVPLITNMNKATIVEDAITYILGLQKTVEVLQDQLCEFEASSQEDAKPRNEVEVDAAGGTNGSGIQAEVQVTVIDEDRLWIKIIFEKKRGGFTRLMEAMRAFGLEFIDANVTTSLGTMLVSSSVKGIYGEKLAVQYTRELLLDIINGI